jgi:hypothetical protein
MAALSGLLDARLNRPGLQLQISRRRGGGFHAWTSLRDRRGA